MKVCHLTSVHKWNDTRIFYKECISLSSFGYNVSLIVPHEKDEIVKGVRVLGVKSSKGGRLKRATLICYRILRRAIKEKAQVYHFHDPELIWVGIILKLLRKKVVFDIHENIRAQIKVKEWLPFRYFFSLLFGAIDYISAKIFFLVLAENSYDQIYKKSGAKYKVVLNFPEINFGDNFLRIRRTGLTNGILYVGSVSKDRGIDITIEALRLLHQKNIDFVFYCIGPIDSKLKAEIMENIKNYNMEEKVFFLGHIPINEAYEYSKRCKVGLSILKPIENYLNSYSTKIFEYMSIGLPVIVSNFKLYDFVEKHDCGICVDPKNPEAIANAINVMLSDDKRSEQMGKNGRKAVLENYNWEGEKVKLIELYNHLA